MNDWLKYLALLGLLLSILTYVFFGIMYLL